MRRAFSYLFGLLVMGAVAWPGLRDVGEDSYPLSTYPMFSSDRSRVCLSRIVGLDARGEQRAVPPRLIANGEIMQARATIQLAVRGGKQARRELCERVARRVAASDDLTGVERLEIITECWAPVAWYTADAEPLQRRRRARCGVER